MEKDTLFMNGSLDWLAGHRIQHLHIRLVGVCIVLTLLGGCRGLDDDLTTAEDSIDIKAADTSSPRDTLKNFIDSCNEVHKRIQKSNYFDRNSSESYALRVRILDCIDMSELPAFARQERAGEVATCLKEILDRVEIPDWEEIPDTTEIEKAGGLEKLSHWRIPGTRITIARVEQGPQRHEYLFSPGTVDRAVEYYESIESLPYRTEGPAVSKNLYRWYLSTPGHPVLGRIVKLLPTSVRFGRTLGLANWKWPGLVVGIALSFSLMGLLYKLYAAITYRVRNQNLAKYCLTIVVPITAILVPFVFKHVMQHYMTLTSTPLYIASFCANVIQLLAALFVVFGVSNRVAECIIASPQINPHGLNAQLIRIVSKLLSVAVSVTLFLVGGQYLGIPIGTLLTSAGIGGVALALGAQDTLKTLFGTIMLMGDKPFRVGERILFKGYDGIVEDIGLRSTKIRLLNSHLVTVPNDELARSDIENIGRRERIRRIVDIQIPLDTTYAQVERAISIVREQLEDHEGMRPDYPPRVFFFDFQATAFTIRAIYWYHPPDQWDYMAFSENFNLAIFQAFEEHGIQFSLPLRHSFWAHDSQQGPFDVRLIDDSTK